MIVNIHLKRLQYDTNIVSNITIHINYVHNEIIECDSLN